ncbi:pimeloyl-ACP methyl ester carboxylesterase [Litorivivens lipolytica]|uniref:Pimeloyl-ACP methyl ester carboxylesterase n=1 Tax=Litorivivens lipolytica TaxID=1524264 RepID=A0A7W4W6C3_9GAMM|nr:pimeloyl-ACP methyl ester carboxylesterase [Litorivivens lipolytica]
MADTFILLRGLGRGQSHWMGFAERLAEACPDASVVCLDLPGNGELWFEKSPLSLEEAARSLRRDCLRRGLQPPFRIVGLSMGAMVGLAWFTAEPSDIKELVMINSSLASVCPIYQRMRPAAFLRLLPGLLSRRWRERAVLSLTCNLRRHDRELLRVWDAIALEQPVSATNVLRQLAAAARYCPQPLPLAPIRLVASRTDRLVDVRCSQAIAEHWQLPLIVHDTAGHDLPVDDPDWLIQTLLHRSQPV